MIQFRRHTLKFTILHVLKTLYAMLAIAAGIMAMTGVYFAGAGGFIYLVKETTVFDDNEHWELVFFHVGFVIGVSVLAFVAMTNTLQLFDKVWNPRKRK